MQKLTKKLNIHCRFVLQLESKQKTKSKNREQDEINEAIEFVKSFSQETTSFGDPLAWQQSEQ